MRGVVLLALLALPSMALATTFDTDSSASGTANLTHTFANRPVQLMEGDMSLFTGGFHNSREDTNNLANQAGGFVVRDSYMVRVFSTSSDCDGDDTCDPPSVPEPSSLSLLATGLIGVAGMFRRKLLAH